MIQSMKYYIIIKSYNELLINSQEQSIVINSNKIFFFLQLDSIPMFYSYH